VALAGAAGLAAVLLGLAAPFRHIAMKLPFSALVELSLHGVLGGFAYAISAVLVARATGATFRRLPRQATPKEPEA
jgi:hypothetical protein